VSRGFMRGDKMLILVALICSLICLAQIPTPALTVTSSGAMQPYPMPTPTPTHTPTPVSVIYLPLALKGWLPPEFRGLWVSRFPYEGVHYPYNSPEDIQIMVNKAKEANFNAIFFQVRGQADAFYRSEYEPWSDRLTGTLGQDPGWDPLATAITMAHTAGLELHAWVNVFTCWLGETPPITTSIPLHIYHEHPEWLQCDESGTPMPLKPREYVYVSPGIPEVQDHIAKVCVDIVSKYDVDGLHLDHIRYAGPQYSHDPVSEERFAQAREENPGLTWEDWQREQVTQMVRRIYSDTTAIRPDLKVTAAVWPVYQDKWGFGTTQGYYDYYQDSHRWIEEDVIDALCPMIYSSAFTIERFGILLGDFVANSHGRHIYTGIHGNYPSFTEILKRIGMARASGAQGNVIFAYTYIDDKGYWDDLRSGPYAWPSGVPPMPWKAQ